MADGVGKSVDCARVVNDNVGSGGVGKGFQRARGAFEQGNLGEDSFLGGKGVVDTQVAADGVGKSFGRAGVVSDNVGSGGVGVVRANGGDDFVGGKGFQKAGGALMQGIVCEHLSGSGVLVGGSFVKAAVAGVGRDGGVQQLRVSRLAVLRTRARFLAARAAVRILSPSTARALRARLR